MNSFNYTKVNDDIVAKYGIKVAYIYAKLCYRMNLSKHNKHYFDGAYFIVYKINDLAKDCHLGRNSVINALKTLAKTKMIKKVHCRFVDKLYLPEFSFKKPEFKNQTGRSLKSKLSKEQRNKNQDYKTKSVNCSSVKAKPIPNQHIVIAHYGIKLFNYAKHVYLRSKYQLSYSINNSYHFIVGILRRWERKGIKAVNDAMKSENDPNAVIRRPHIPIFEL